MKTITKKTIDEFYNNKTIAVIGASRDAKKFGGAVLKELLDRDYNAIPVNPYAETIQDKTCYKSVKDISDKVTAAIALVPSEAQEQIVLEAAEAGIKALWLHGQKKKSLSNNKAVSLCEEKGIECITGFCPLMFIPNTRFPHNLHKGILKLFGSLPK